MCARCVCNNSVAGGGDIGVVVVVEWRLCEERREGVGVWSWKAEDICGVIVECGDANSVVVEAASMQRGYGSLGGEAACETGDVAVRWYGGAESG